MDRYEVTHAQYAHFLNEVAMPYEQAFAAYDIKDPSSRIVYVDGRYRVYRGAERLPVYGVTWYGANAFCDHYGKRLPRQLEWQKATGYLDDGRLYPWGNDTDFARRANLNHQDDGYPFWAAVDSMPAGVSPFGLYHLAGNVAEWMEGYYVAGSSFELGPREARNDFRDANHALARNLHDGFRCVADVNKP
jgi:formylglycine-generating enzyme required for sulfatase activity